MADAKISELTAIADPVVGTDAIAIVRSGAAVTSKATLAQIAGYLGGIGMNRVFSLVSDHAISSTTATEVTGLGPVTLEPGTYVFNYYLIVQSATVTVSPMFSLNFTGTAVKKVFWFDYADASATLLAAIGTMDDQGVSSLGFGMRAAQNAYSTSAPNMGNTGSANAVANINSNILCKITGTLVVTASGDLELWHGSETATSTTLMAGSSAIVVRTA